MNGFIRRLPRLSCCCGNQKHVGVIQYRLQSSKNDHVTTQLEILKNILQGDYDTTPQQRVNTDPLGSPIIINIVRVVYQMMMLFLLLTRSNAVFYIVYFSYTLGFINMGIKLCMIYKCACTYNLYMSNRQSSQTEENIQ